MGGSVRRRVLVGTVKGGFWLTQTNGDSWKVDGPLFKGWKVTAGTRLSTGRFLIGVASDIYGPAIQISDDLANWSQAPQSPAYPEGGDRRLKQIWTLAENRGRVYAGVQQAGLFISDDLGATWEGVDGLNDHESRKGWVPGAGGLCAHALLFHPTNPSRMWCGISAVGVFRTDDGGATWVAKNEGIPSALEDETFKDIGRCVHGLALDPDDPDRMYRQDHMGMYRSFDGGDHWSSNESGLPSGFGFPIRMHTASGTLFAAPQESDECRLPVGGAMLVARSTDRGDTWHSASKGLPSENTYGTVLRGAMDVDGEESGGVYVGTTAGTMHISRDLGGTWQTLPVTFPRILHVSTWAE